MVRNQEAATKPTCAQSSGIREVSFFTRTEGPLEIFQVL